MTGKLWRFAVWLSTMKYGGTAMVDSFDAGEAWAMETWRQKMRSRRRALGMTQEDLAGALGVDQTSISDWERGKREPDLATLHGIAKALKWHPAVLLADVDPTDIQVIRLKAILARIPQREREHYMGLLESRGEAVDR